MNSSDRNYIFGLSNIQSLLMHHQTQVPIKPEDKTLSDLAVELALSVLEVSHFEFQTMTAEQIRLRFYSSQSKRLACELLSLHFKDQIINNYTNVVKGFNDDDVNVPTVIPSKLRSNLHSDAWLTSVVNNATSSSLSLSQKFDDQLPAGYSRCE